MVRQYHIALERGEVGRYVLLPGDPGRCAPIAAAFDDAQLVASNREYTTYTGALAGVPVSVMSTGIGAPSTAIAVEELAAVGADTFIRVGTAGAISPRLRKGDLVAALAAVRDEGTTRQYVPLSYPAVTDPDVYHALVSAAADHGYPLHGGVIRSTDALYADLAPETMPLHALYAHDPNTMWARGGVLCAEMEAAALFVVSTLHRLRAGCLLTVVNSVGGAIEDEENPSLDPMIATAIGALRTLIALDAAP